MVITESTSFQQIIAMAFDETGLTKEAVAAEMGRNPATVYRILSSQTVSKPNAQALVRAINKLAMFRVIDESAALRAAGYTADRVEVNSTIVASVIDNFVWLPDSVQADVLEQIIALRRKYAA